MGGVSHNYPRDMLQDGVSHRCACVELSTPVFYFTFIFYFWELLRIGHYITVTYSNCLELIRIT